MVPLSGDDSARPTVLSDNAIFLGFVDLKMLRSRSIASLVSITCFDHRFTVFLAGCAALPATALRVVVFFVRCFWTTRFFAFDFLAAAFLVDGLPEVRFVAITP